MTTAISINNLCFRYHKNWIINHFSMDILANQCHIIKGDNGSGKTSLLKLIEGELRPEAGEIFIHPDLKKSSAYLPQFHQFDLQIPVTLAEMLAMGLWKVTGAFKPLPSQAKQQIQDAIQLTGLQGLEQHLISELSGGQLQRARFARTWLQDSKLILLDEPFSSVDQTSQDILWKIIDHWQQAGKTLLMVLHENPIPHFLQYNRIDMPSPQAKLSYV